jgi:hypothetical protein
MSVDKSKMNSNERLKYIIDQLHETSYSFSRSIGLSRADTIYHVLSGKTPISIRLAKIIIDTYPNINMEWLLTGEGTVFTWQDKPLKREETVNEEHVKYSTACPVCHEKERLIESLESRIQEQKLTICSNQKCIDILSRQGGIQKNASSG